MKFFNNALLALAFVLGCGDGSGTEDDAGNGGNNNGEPLPQGKVSRIEIRWDDPQDESDELVVPSGPIAVAKFPGEEKPICKYQGYGEDWLCSEDKDCGRMGFCKLYQSSCNWYRPDQFCTNTPYAYLEVWGYDEEGRRVQVQNVKWSHNPADLVEVRFQSTDADAAAAQVLALKDLFDMGLDQEPQTIVSACVKDQCKEIQIAGVINAIWKWNTRVDLDQGNVRTYLFNIWLQEGHDIQGEDSDIDFKGYIRAKEFFFRHDCIGQGCYYEFRGLFENPDMITGRFLSESSGSQYNGNFTSVRTK